MTQRILVIDDEAHIVQVLSLKLRNAGYEVLTACDGEEGLEVVRAADKGNPELCDARATGAGHAADCENQMALPVDLIITDFQMPYMTGLELCKELAKNARWSTIPVLMLTARGYALDTEDVAMASAAGGPIIRDVLTKPFSPRAIVEHIQRILGNERGDEALGTGTKRVVPNSSSMRNEAA